MSGKIVTCLWFAHGEARKAANSTRPHFLTAMSDMRFSRHPITLAVTRVAS